MIDIDQIIEEYKKGIEEKINKLNEELSNLKIKNTNIEADIAEMQKKRYFRRSKRDENNKLIDEKKKEVENNEERRKDIESEIYNLKEYISKLDDKDYIIKEIIKNNPELLKNSKFIEELLKINPFYIIYDKSNDPNLYLNLFNKLFEINEKSNYIAEIKENRKKILISLIEELQTPKEVQDEKYKIPHKFIFDGIRKRLFRDYINSRDTENIENDTKYEDILDVAISVMISYINKDGIYMKEFGETIEKMFEDEKYYYGRADAFPETLNAILQNGYELNYGVIDGNFYINNELDIFHFLGATKPGGGYRPGRDIQIIAMIPKNPTNEEQIFGTDNTGQMYLLPKYIAGYIEPKENQENATFTKNPILKNERKQYNFEANNISHNTGIDDYISKGGFTR